MSSGIDNSGTGGASGKKSKPKKNKFGQISSHDTPVEQQSVSVPHGNRQGTTTSQSCGGRRSLSDEVKSKVKRFNSTGTTNYVGYYTQNP
jgi:hypothetical protein